MLTRESDRSSAKPALRRAKPYSRTSSSASIQLDAPHELTLAKHIVRFGETIEAVARDLKPHILATYLYELATKFSGFYENCPVLQSEEPIRSSGWRYAI
jgi:arginyl-tRNA synthetase